MPKTVKTLLKISISIILFYLVFTKIDINQIIELLKKSNWVYIALAIFCFISSQIVSSFRLNYIFQKNNFHLNQVSNLKLYFIGMFYNFFIPGGIGGDAYKIYLLNKKLDWNSKATTKCILVDRLIGLVGIAFLICAFATNIYLEGMLSWVAFISSIIIVYFLGKFVCYKIIKNTHEFFYNSFLFSLAIQILQITAILCIVVAYNLNLSLLNEFSLVFLISSVLSVVSFAGFGSREYVFLKAAPFLQTTDTLATSIPLSFNIITAIVSLLGVLFIIQKINLKPSKKN